MKLATLETIFRALNEAGVRYLVAGGVAVNAHGYQRLTQDLDLVLQLTPENIRNAFAALTTLDYRPVLPVNAGQFADREKRQEWIEHRNLEVFSLVSDDHPDTTVDLFVTEPFEFDVEFEKAMIGEIAPELEVRVVSLQTLIEMKEATGRARDRDDAEHLREILREQHSDDED